MIVVTQITESARFILGVYVTSQSDFSVTVKGHTKIGRQTGKRIGTNRDPWYLHWFHKVVQHYTKGIGNKAQARISKWKWQKNIHIFWKKEHFLPRDMHTHKCLSGGNKCSFFGKFGVLFFLLPPFWDSSFCLITDETASDRRSRAKVEAICEIHLGNRQLSRFCCCRMYIASAVFFSRWLLSNKICLFL